MNIQVLMNPGCGHGRHTLELVTEVVRMLAPRAEIETITVSTPQDASLLAFPGSPTVRVNGIDIEPHAPTNVGLG